MKFTKAEEKLFTVCKNIPYSILRFSKNRVPHVLCYKEKVQHSIAYFMRDDIYKVFYPYRSDNQEQVVCKGEKELYDFFGVAMPEEKTYDHDVRPDKHHRR